jgi:hypothetical protein
MQRRSADNRNTGPRVNHYGPIAALDGGHSQLLRE